MRLAKIHVSVMGDDSKQDLTIRGLQHAAGFLQQRIGQRIDTRYTPKLRFVLDRGVKNALEVTRILNEVLPPKTDHEDANDNDANRRVTGEHPDN